MKSGWQINAALGILFLGGVLTTGCEHKGGGVDNVAGTGNSAIIGNIVNFGIERAPSSVAGTRVYLEGTDIEADVGADGFFRFDNVPAGTYTVVFELNGLKGELQITFGENEEVTISDVIVYSDGSVTANVTIRPINNLINVSGNWLVSGLVTGYVGTRFMTLNQHDEHLTGTLGLPPGMIATYNLMGRINGQRITLTGTFKTAISTTIELTGNVNQHATEMSGTWTSGGDSGSWSAVRGGATD